MKKTSISSRRASNRTRTRTEMEGVKIVHARAPTCEIVFCISHAL